MNDKCIFLVFRSFIFIYLFVAIFKAHDRDCVIYIQVTYRRWATYVRNNEIDIPIRCGLRLYLSVFIAVSRITNFVFFLCKQSGGQRFFVAFLPFQVASVMAWCITLQSQFCSLVSHTVAVCESRRSNYFNTGRLIKLTCNGELITTSLIACIPHRDPCCTLSIRIKFKRASLFLLTVFIYMRKW